MKTPLADGDALIKKLLLEYWQIPVTCTRFIPIGDSAYSYRVEASPDRCYYLKIVDRSSAVGQRTAARMNFSLPLQRLVAEHRLPTVAAPVPQPATRGALHVERDQLLLALYNFIPGDTLADAYPLAPALVQRIGQALAALHAIPIPQTLQPLSPQDDLDAPFDAALHANLDALATITARDAPHLRRLRELVWPRREQILAFQARGHGYRERARQLSVPPVLCHGDVWGGNIIPTSSNQLTLLDWEAAVIAPPERDAYMYIGESDFAAFDAGYRAVHKEPMRWHADLLAHYAYRHQLRNLSHWLHTLLHEPLNEEQRENDLNMIGFHCLDRFERIERTAETLRL